MEKIIIEELSKQLEDLYKNLTKSLDPTLIKTPNPLYGVKGQNRNITIEEMNQVVSKEYDFGEVSDDPTIDYMLKGFRSIGKHNDII